MTHTLDAIAWTLIHFCWQAAAVALLYRMAMVACARSASQTRYALAVLTLALMTCGAFATFAWEMRSARSSPTLQNAAMEFRNVALDAIAPRAVGEPSASPAAVASSSANLLRWIDGAWVLGVAVLSLRTLGGWWVIQKLRATAIVEAPEAVRTSFARIAAVLGLRRQVLLRVSSAVAGPITVGAIRTMVLLPISAITLLSPDELEMVLAHELAHVRRADFLCNMVQTLVETLFFFHPAVWWMGKRIRHERELCCDDLALEICPSPVTYATALFRLEEHRARQWRLAMALDGNQSNQTLRMRIARILGEPAAQIGGRSVQPFSLIVAAVALAVSLLAAPPVVASFSPSHAAHAQHLALVATSVKTPVGTIHASLTPSTPHAAVLQAAASAVQEKAEDAAPPKSTYIDRMKAAGYDVDLDKYIAMKIQGVTPEFAQQMAQAGFGKLSADDLIACKIQGVSPDVIAQLRQQGFEIKSIQDAISFRIFGVTPEFVTGMKTAGFSNLTSQQLIGLRVQGVTPDYARSIVQEFPGATVDDVIKTRIFHIDGAFIEQAKHFGLKQLTLDKLVQLRVSGILDDDSSRP
ncbi:MAG TPA: M56 family metallopeptidase [Terracidiphilus sp.]|jgi:beta-lactamase regulating signal transducer with metallopeptidase domain|nr:M56 family metallopeptidase [Terracidiphilus sp.]